MSLIPGEVWEAGLAIVLSVASSAAVVRRLMSGPVGKQLARLVTEAMGELVGKVLEAERPKVVEALRADIRKVVREETESLRERLARLEGVVEGAGLTVRNAEHAKPAEGGHHG